MPEQTYLLLEHIKVVDERANRIETKLDRALDGISDLKESRAKTRGVLLAATGGIPILSGLAAFFGRIAGH